MPPLLLTLVLGGAFFIGIAGGYWLRYLHALSQKNSLELDLKEKLVEAEAKAVDIVEKAEEKAEKITLEAKTERKEREEKLNQKEARLEKREELLDERQIDIDSQKEGLTTKIEQIKSIKVRLDEKEAQKKRLI